MKDKCLAGIHKVTGVVEIVAMLGDHMESHLEEIEKDGCYAVIADKSLAKESWGKKIDHPLDLVVKY